MKNYDILIIGGGAAGMSCALILGSAKDKDFAKDKNIGIVMHQKASHLQDALFNNVLGLEAGTTGKTILEKGKNQLATLYPHIRELNPITRYSIMLVASDANWALSMRAFSQNKVQEGLGLLFGGGLALWAFWALGTWAGFYLGNTISNPSSFGFDMVMGCFLLTMVLEGNKDNKTSMIWLVAGVTSIAAYFYLPENSHVIVGALSGGLMGIVIGDKKQDD